MKSSCGIQAMILLLVSKQNLWDRVMRNQSGLRSDYTNEHEISVPPDLFHSHILKITVL